MASYYVSQNGSGAQTGLSPSNAWSLASFNTASNWAATSTAGKISPGDTVTLSGTITTVPVIQGSGTAGSPITIKFAPSSKLSVPFCSTSGQLQIISKSYITIDGANVGIIESTANGTGLANQQAGIGLKVNASSYITIKDLTIRTIYVRTADSSDSFTGPRGISLEESSHCTVQNCSISDAEVGIHAYTSAGIVVNVNLTGNTIFNVAQGIIAELGLDGTSMTGLTITRNSIGALYVWDGMWDGNYHVAYGILVQGRSGTTDPVTAPVIRENAVVGDMGAHCGALLMCRYGVMEPRIYGNILKVTVDNPTNGMIVIMGVGGVPAVSPLVYNNTIVGLAATSVPAIRTVSAPGLSYRNNISTGCQIGVAETDGISLTAVADHNLYHGLEANGFFRGGTMTSLSAWQSAGLDPDVLTSDPLLDASSVIRGRASPAVGRGVNLSAAFNTDAYGKVRPLSRAWDLGAIAYYYTVPQRVRGAARMRGRGVVTLEDKIGASGYTIYTFGGQTLQTFAGGNLEVFTN